MRALAATSVVALSLILTVTAFGALPQKGVMLIVRSRARPLR